MTVIEKTARVAGQWSDRLVGRLVPQISADAADTWREACSCQCHTVCYRYCTRYQSGQIVCGPCNRDCRYSSGCSSC